MEKVAKQFSRQDWEEMIDDFQSGSQQKWLSQYPGLTILELALYTVVKKDFLLKSQLITFVEENADTLIARADTDEGLGSVVEALKAVVQAPADGIVITYALKEQMMVAATSVMIIADSLHCVLHHLEALVKLLLGVINRPNHGVDRQARAIACECLRQLEKAYPCLLYAYAGHLLLLCQSERTHSAQSYILLLTMVICNLACHMYNNTSSRVSNLATSILSTSVSWVPFNVPPFLAASAPGEEIEAIRSRELAPINRMEFHRLVAFLLERPQILTSCGMLEFVLDLINVAAALKLQVSLLKVQFSGLIYSYSPMLCHIVLMIYTHFLDAFSGEDKNIRRLILITKEVSQPFIIRLLATHWMLGLESLLLQKNKKPTLISMASVLYPSVFDPLSLKAIKLDALAYCAINFDPSLREGLHHSTTKFQPVTMEQLSVSDKEDYNSVALGEITAEKLFNDGLACVSSFQWLPPGSTETRLAFRMLHRFLTVAIPHPATNEEDIHLFTESALFDKL